MALAATFFLSGCVTTSINVISHSQTPKKIETLHIAGISLDSIYSYTEKKKELETILITSAQREGITLQATDDQADSPESIRFFLREKPYSRGFKAFVSLAMIAEIVSPEGTVLYRISYLHDGDDSFDSLGFVKTAADAIFRDLRIQLDKEEKQSLKKSGME